MPSESRVRVFAARLALVVAALAALACAGGRSGSERGGLPVPRRRKRRRPKARLRRRLHADAGVAEPEDAGEQDDRRAAITPSTKPCWRSPAAASAKRAEPPLGLRFGVVERGPGKRWLLALLNEGKDPVRVIADQRLLWFEVEVPGKRAKKTTCRLPDALFPARIDHRAELVLEPGEAVADSFDPRLYCFGVKGQTQLVPGAVIKPYFGWPAKKSPVRNSRRGKPAQAPAERAPPFVATPATVISGANARIPTQDELCDSEEANCVKLLEGESFGMRSEYKAWSFARIEQDDKLRENPGPIEIVLTQGSDAEAERNATVTLSVKNRTKRRAFAVLPPRARKLRGRGPGWDGDL